MAINEQSVGIIRPFTIASEVSGNPVLIGAALIGVCETTSDAVTNQVMVNIATNRVWTLSVKGIDQGGNSAVVVGDQLYIVTADTPRISKKNTGVKFGKALGAVNSAATATIPVLLTQV